MRIVCAVCLLAAGSCTTTPYGFLSGPRPEAVLCAGRDTSRCGRRDTGLRYYACPTNRVELVYTLVNAGELPLEYELELWPNRGSPTELVVTEGRATGTVLPFDSVELVIACRTDNCLDLLSGTGLPGDYTLGLSSNDPRSQYNSLSVRCGP